MALKKAKSAKDWNRKMYNWALRVRRDIQAIEKYLADNSGPGKALPRKFKPKKAPK